MQSYRDLEIYKLAHSLETHALTMKLPKYELFEEGSQARRSAKSVSANIVEGFSRKRYRTEYVRYLIFSHGSCNETIEHLEILKETDSCNKNTCDNLIMQYEKLGGMLNKFIAAVDKG